MGYVRKHPHLPLHMACLKSMVVASNGEGQGCWNPTSLHDMHDVMFMFIKPKEQIEPFK